jgi:hypothetical protein
VTFNEADALAYDPFADSFGGSGRYDRCLRDTIVTARKTFWCHMCGGDVAPGTRSRARTDIFDGELVMYRWCAECCLAMAADVQSGNSVDQTTVRYQMGLAR